MPKIANALKKTVHRECFLAFTSEAAREIYRAPKIANALKKNFLNSGSFFYITKLYVIEFDIILRKYHLVR